MNDLDRDEEISYVALYSTVNVETKKPTGTKFVFPLMNAPIKDRDKENTSYKPKKAIIQKGDISFKDSEWFDFSIDEYILGKQEWPVSMEAVDDGVRIEETAFDSEDGNVKLQLDCLIYISSSEMLEARRFPEAIMFDCTCKTNKYNYAYMFMLGCNSSWFTTIFGHCLLLKETYVNFQFIWAIGMRVIYGRTMDCVLNVITDGDPNMINAVESVIEQKLIGNGGTVRNRCYYHAICQTFSDAYGAYKCNDGGIGFTVLRCVKVIIFYAESKQELLKEWKALTSWLSNYPTTTRGAFTP